MRTTPPRDESTPIADNGPRERTMGGQAEHVSSERFVDEAARAAIKTLSDDLKRCRKKLADAERERDNAESDRKQADAKEQRDRLAGLLEKSLRYIHGCPHKANCIDALAAVKETP